MLSVKLVISLVALALLIGHIAMPGLSIDAISLGFLIVSILPWAASLIESAKFPGGWEIKFRDLKSASDKIEAAQPETAKRLKFRDAKAADSNIPLIVEADANLALVALRIEIERRIRLLAQRHGIDASLPLARLFRELYRQEVLQESVFSSLEEIVHSGNRAAHGASVEPAVQRWALESGSKIVATLDGILAQKEG